MEEKLGNVGLYGMIVVVIVGLISWVFFGKIKALWQLIAFFLTATYVLFRKEHP